MLRSVAPPEIDYAKLESSLRALAYASRLELLYQLRVPRAISDIRLQPAQTRHGENPERAMARQSVLEHIDKLVEAGVVVPLQRSSTEARDGPGRPPVAYSVNPQRLFAILEEMRRVCSMPVQHAAREDATAPLGARVAAPPAPGPKLVLVHGLYDGKVFPLRDADMDATRGWLVGRRDGLPVALEYDPFVSTENAEVLRTSGGQFAIHALPGTRNGTTHNWLPLADEQVVPLAPGDVIGVGRSLLVFRER